MNGSVANVDLTVPRQTKIKHINTWFIKSRIPRNSFNNSTELNFRRESVAVVDDRVSIVAVPAVQLDATASR